MLTIIHGRKLYGSGSIYTLINETGRLNTRHCQYNDVEGDK